MSSGTTAQDKIWKSKEQGDETRYVLEKEQEQLAALRNQIKEDEDRLAKIREQIKKDEAQERGMMRQTNATADRDRDFEGGFGGQEDLEDRYATTSGEH